MREDVRTGDVDVVGVCEAGAQGERTGEVGSVEGDGWRVCEFTYIMWS